MKDNIQIRFYTPKDYPEVKAIYQSEGAWFRQGIDDEENLKNKIKRDPESILVAESISKIIGTISLIEDGRMAFLVRLAVLESERKKGVGTLLLQEAEKILKKRGLVTVNILVNEREESLYEYYEHRGYSRGSKHMWMWKELT